MELITCEEAFSSRNKAAKKNKMIQINIAVFGVGTVGSAFVNQVLSDAQLVKVRANIQLCVFAIANSSKVILSSTGFVENWERALHQRGEEYVSIDVVLRFAREHQLQNLIAIDNTASRDLVASYSSIIKSGFDVVSSNKIANTLSYSFYKQLRSTLEEHQKIYAYETNVGAGLPLIHTLRLLHDSGERIAKVRGVFSGSLSYLFNAFSSQNRTFSEVLKEAVEKGFTEPDPREDLCGNDVARKLLILARELGAENEFEEVQVENLIPVELREGGADYFLSRLDKMNALFLKKKEAQPPDHVLRYVGELSGDLVEGKMYLAVKLISVPVTSSLGGLKHSDTIFEVYTDSYGQRPFVIQGAGAGAEVTARGVFGDVLRLAKTKQRC